MYGYSITRTGGYSGLSKLLKSSSAQAKIYKAGLHKTTLIVLENFYQASLADENDFSKNTNFSYDWINEMFRKFGKKCDEYVLEHMEKAIDKGNKLQHSRISKSCSHVYRIGDNSVKCQNPKIENFCGVCYNGQCINHW
jgi:hypothetical protein